MKPGKRGLGMPRTKPARSVIAILASDWHLREDTPICRTDDFWAAQQAKLDHINGLQRKYQVPVVHGGDLFEHWKPSPFLLSFCLRNLPSEYGFYSVYGNHDLPQHSLDLVQKSGVETLEAAGKLETLPGVHWGQEPQEAHITEWGPKGLRLLVWHVMTWHGKRPWPGCEDPSAEELLNRFPEVDLILTGHNHVPFLVEKDGRKIMNPGSVMRVKADQQDHEPSVYLWYSDNSLQQVILPHDKGVITREHIEAKPAQDPRRYQAFIEGLREDSPEISFEANMEAFLREYKTSSKVRELIWQSIEGES